MQQYNEFLHELKRITSPESVPIIGYQCLGSVKISKKQIVYTPILEMKHHRISFLHFANASEMVV